jgi:ribose transport system ATP-binding protein
MLTVKNITKRFPGVLALDDVSLSIEAGKVTALVGENGAGKSTLMKILSGVYPDYEGTLEWKGRPVRFAHTKEAQQQGIAIIHQELNLIPQLSIAENIFLGQEPQTRWGTVDKATMHRETEMLLQKLKLEVAATTRIADLKVGQQQVVEIAKALQTQAELIIMDEPTSAITGSEVDVLFGIIEEFVREGKAIVYVSHKLDELFRIADNYVVLRDGKCVESGSMKGVSQDILISKMVGREIEILRRKSNPGRTESPRLRVQNLTLINSRRRDDLLLRDISFEVSKGEIVGIFGLMGAGRTELLECLFGLHSNYLSGAISVNGQQVTIGSPTDAMRAGLALVPEDRKKDGLVLDMDVRSNICLTSLAEMEQWGMSSEIKKARLSEKYIRELSIKTPGDGQKARNLSGGNQQKIVLAKWLATDPIVLLLDEPTRGIDINAKSEIYKLITELASQGLGIVVVSSELPEILAISDRILVMSEGRLTANLPNSEASEDLILKAAIPKSIYEN